MTEDACHRSAAPGWPGIPPTWTSSAKDMITTSLGPARVWATVGFGVINEVYWPTTGEPQLRDLGFIVASPSGWYEVKRVAQYALSLPDPHAPLPRIVHEGNDYRLELEVTPDPLRDVLLISFKLTGNDLKLYALVAPHIRGSGQHNNARASDALVAWKEGMALHVEASCGFSRTSAGYVGQSDGWQDFARHGSLQWSFGEALDGNVALTGELNGVSGVLALGFSETTAGARTLARLSLAESFESARRACCSAWEAWAADLLIPEAPDDIRCEAILSAVMLKAHESRVFTGATVASLSIPWGNTSDSIGGYHLVWTRDAVEAGLALVALGLADEAREMLSYLVATQRSDGGWDQSSFPGGVPFWTGIQLDEAGFPILLAAKLFELGALDGLSTVPMMVQKAIRYIAGSGPSSPQDRWEENAGISPFTIGIQVTALIAGAQWLAGADRVYALSLADYWNARIEDWTYAVGGPLAERFGVDGYYVRIAPPADQGGLRGRIDIRNRGGKNLPADAIVGMEYLYLPRLGLRDADDIRIQNTLTVTEKVLGIETPNGIVYRRYNEDGYGEHEDGGPFDGSGIGGGWPLLIGERGHLDLLRGVDPLPYLKTMARMTGPGGLIPEQVWTGPPIPNRGLNPGSPSGSAMPLVWAHAEFLKLLAARAQGRPLELLTCVDERYHARAPIAQTWHWRASQPFATLPTGCALLIESTTPFRLRCGFDGWRWIADIAADPQGLGIYGVRFEADVLAAHSTLDFTSYFPETECWEGTDHRIAFAA